MSDIIKKYIFGDPGFGVSSPHHWQSALTDVLQSTWVLAMVNQQWFQLAVSFRVSPQCQRESVLGGLEPRGSPLLPRDVSPKKKMH